MTLVQKEVKAVYKWTVKVRPVTPSLVYDFTQSDAWWNANGCARDSRWFYRTNSWSDGRIVSPSEVLVATPKKISIVFNKVYQSSGTALGWKDTVQEWWYWLPLNYNQQAQLSTRCNGTDTIYNLSWTPSGVCTWELNIDSSTTPRTVTHKITWLTDVTETSWILDYIWGNWDGVTIRAVNRSSWTWSMCIQSATFEY